MGIEPAQLLEKRFNWHVLPYGEISECVWLQSYVLGLAELLIFGHL